MTWAADKPASTPVFLYGLETLLPTRDEDRQFRTIQEINWRRNVYSQLGRNLVIWLPEYALTLLARQASDFYDWHSAVFEFPVPDLDKSGMVEQSMLGFMDGEVHAYKRLTLTEKHHWLGVLNGLLDETPKESAEYARLLNNLGLLHRSLGEYEDALKCFQQSFDIFKGMGDQASLGTLLNDISLIHMDHGEYDAALQYLEDALEVNCKWGIKKEKWLTLNNIARVFYFKQNYSKSKYYFETVLASHGEEGFKDDSYGVALNGIGKIYLTQGDYDKALTCFDNSLMIFRKMKNRSGEGATLRNISLVYYSKGDNDKALVYIEGALKIQREIGHQYGICVSLINKGRINTRQGNLAEAENARLEAYRIAKEIGHADGLKALEKLAKDLGKEGLAYWEAQL